MLKPIYALVGSDPFLQLEAVRELLATFGKDQPQRADFDGESAQLVSVLDELRCFSMFSTFKLVVVREGDDFVSRWREGLERFVAALADGSETVAGSLVLRMSSLPANQKIYKLITKAGEVRKCEPPTPRELPGWIVKRAKSVHAVEIEPAAAGQLAELIGAEMGRLDTELAKLAIQTTTGKITAADVKSTVAFQREQEIKEVTALLARGKPGEAIEKWRHLIQSDPSAEFKAVTWIGMWLEKARAALAAKDNGANPGQLMGITWIRDPVELKDFMTTAGKIGRPGLTRLLDELTTLDQRTKSGLGSAADSVERFLATATEN